MIRKIEIVNFRSIQELHKHIGSNFDDFLAEEGILEQTEPNAIKRVIAYQLNNSESPIVERFASGSISKRTLTIATVGYCMIIVIRGSEFSLLKQVARLAASW
jgi:hypothetical protein